MLLCGLTTASLLLQHVRGKSKLQKKEYTGIKKTDVFSLEHNEKMLQLPYIF